MIAWLIVCAGKFILRPDLLFGEHNLALESILRGTEHKSVQGLVAKTDTGAANAGGFYEAHL